MATPIELLWKQALKTFTGCESSNFRLCQKNFEKLNAMMNNIKAEDVKVDKKVLDYVANHRSPMCVIDIFNNKDITIAIFLLKNGVTLPMHDHPGMYGLLKVLSGTIKIDSYTTQIPTEHVLQMNEELNALKHPTVVVQKTDPACVIRPNDHNLHEITCIKGTAAFLDILSPSYKVDASDDEEVRTCTFFKQVSPDVSSTSTDSPAKVKIRVMEQPPYLYSVALPYLGPPLMS